LLPALCAVLVTGVVLITGFSSGSPAQASDAPAANSPDAKVEGSGNNNVYSTEQRVVPDVANRGQYLFIQGCSTCHGVNGQGTDQAPSLIGVGAAAADFYISTGRMPLNQPLVQAPRKKPLYNDEDRAAIVNYVATFGDGPEIPHVDEEAGDLVQGNILYAQNCAACHNSAGSGGALGRNYYAPRLDASTPEQIAEAIRIGPGGMPVFGHDTLTDQQVNSIVRYIGEITENKGPGGFSLGRLGPVSEGFLAWTLGLGILIGFIYWIGTRV
jgi:ubiquinol-cytochrome c reductase cytochrome c subunit